MLPEEVSRADEAVQAQADEVRRLKADQGLGNQVITGPMLQTTRRAPGSHLKSIRPTSPLYKLFNDMHAFSTSSLTKSLTTVTGSRGHTGCRASPVDQTEGCRGAIFPRSI